jgi:hypothetical protein
MDEKSWNERVRHLRARAVAMGERQVMRGRWWADRGWVYYVVPVGSISDYQLQAQREHTAVLRGGRRG